MVRSKAEKCGTFNRKTLAMAHARHALDVLCDIQMAISYPCQASTSGLTMIFEFCIVALIDSDDLQIRRSNGLTSTNTSKLCDF